VPVFYSGFGKCFCAELLKIAADEIQNPHFFALFFSGRIFLSAAGCLCRE
jgi:hypothetical protein